jgi:hypothetical protein
MKYNVLYFPKIRVPNSIWLTRLLLYWDSVGTIVPAEFISKPEELGEHTRSLVEHQLVRQIIPDMYLWQIPNFDTQFLSYLDSLGNELNKRRKRFESGKFQKLHIEKLVSLKRRLAKRGVAKKIPKSSWYRVEETTAEEFMCYLASVLGGHKEVDAMPISDDPDCLKKFLISGKRPDSKNKQYDEVRMDILKDVFPAPSRALHAEEIADFKRIHRPLLGRLRRAVEREILSVMDLRNKNLRKERLRLFREEMQDDVTELQARFKEKGWGDFIFGRLFGVIAAVPGVSPTFGLASAIFSALRGSQGRSSHLDDSHFAYAAHYKDKLMD